jgi:hypothetical protein
VRICSIEGPRAEADDTHSAIHFVLATYSLALTLNVHSLLHSWEAWQLSMSNCPTCAEHNEGRISTETDESVKFVEGRVTRGDVKGKMSVANEEGEGEGDRLILVDEGEA